jgi:hypothetical protein
MFVVVVGCDGDGDGGTTTTETTSEETGTVEEPKGPVTVDTGSETIDPWDDVVLSVFDIYETGLVKARVEWSSGPSTLSISLVHVFGVGEGVFQPSIQSPAVLEMQATQDLLDNSNQWVVNVSNSSGSEQAMVNYTVTFMPD